MLTPLIVTVLLVGGPAPGLPRGPAPGLLLEVRSVAIPSWYARSTFGQLTVEVPAGRYTLTVSNTDQDGQPVGHPCGQVKTVTVPRHHGRSAHAHVYRSIK
jgi:hypothetical protein